MIIYAEETQKGNIEALDMIALLFGTRNSNPNLCLLEEDDGGKKFFDIEDELFEYVLHGANDAYVLKLIEDGYKIMNDLTFDIEDI